MFRHLLILSALATLPALAAEADQAPPHAVTASMLTAEDAAVPGAVLEVGWRFALADGWHLYTQGRSDTGFPPDVTLELPAGWEAGPLRWPVGHRLESPGGLLDHVYEDEVVLLQALRVAADARPGVAAVVSAKLNWLACREACVPGDTMLTATVPVAAHATVTPQAVRLAEMRSQLPHPPAGDELTADWRGAVLTVAVPGASHLEFHPAADAGPMTDPLADAAADADVLSLRFRPRDGHVGPARGTLIVANGDDVRHLTLDIPAVPAAVQPEGDPQ